ncbi:hypothetical protein [Rubrivirga sp.]|uniref:hypothetical protein n=1 Tax=Rubrivirga sp. TaxID=1885344 RepID=UPI003B516C43
MKRLMLLCSLLALVACEQTNPQPVAEVLPAASDPVLSRVDFARAPGASQEDLTASVKAALTATVNIAKKADGWQDAHDRAQEAVAAAEPGVVRSNVEQAMAKLMLTGYLVPNRSEEGVPELALEYSRALVQHESPEAETILESVGAFRTEWGPIETRSVAVRAAEAAESYVAETARCTDCDMPEAARRDLSDEGRDEDVVSARRLEAAAQLRALAE